MASRALRSFEQFYRAVSGDIFLFAKELGLNPTHQQKQLFDAVQRGCPRIAVKSGQGPGKTLSTGVVGLWRLMRHKNAKLIVTGPTMAQCKDVWLAQAQKLVQGERANPAFRKMFQFTATGIGVMGMPQKMWGCLLKTSTSSEGLQGQHETNMDVIVEEASGVDREFIEQFEGTLSNPNAMFLQVGNPNCVMGHTEVYDQLRGRMTVQELAELDRPYLKVAAMDEQDQKIDSRLAKAIYSGEKDCVSVRVNTGQILDLSHDHPVYTPTGWVDASELKEGDLVAMPRSLPEPQEYLDVTDEEVKFIAYMLTDGCTTRNKSNKHIDTSHCSFTQMPGPILDDFLETVRALGGEGKREKNKSIGKSVTINCSGLQDVLRKWGISCCSAHTKRVPSEFYKLNKRQLALFINRMWSCDGSFNRYGPKLCLCNKKLLDDVQTLLLRLGIHSSIWHTPVDIKESNKTFEHLRGRAFRAWTLGVTDQPSHKKWNDSVGPVLGKEDKMPDIKKKHNTNSDVVPIENKQIQEMFDEMQLPSGKGKGGQRSRLSYKYRRKWRLSRKMFKEFCEETGYSGKYSHLASNDIRWVKVTSLWSLGTQKVYDLCVPERGNFVAQNIIIHNTSDCAFYDCFTSDRHRWEAFTWNAEETPASSWFNPQRNKDAEEKYGRDSDFYRIRVLGEFPHSDPNCIMKLDDIYGVTGKENAHLRLEMARKLYKGKILKRFGMDFARYGGDENIICRRQGYSVLDLNFYPHTDPNDIIDIAFEMQKKALWSNQDTLYVADAGGIGQGVMGNFHRTKHRVHEFHNNGRAKYPKEFDNKISEAWFYVRDLVKSRGIYLPDDSILHKQLSTRQYFLTKKGKICIETKDEYKKRGHGSPDRAEGVIYAMYDYADSSGRFAG